MEPKIFVNQKPDGQYEIQIPGKTEWWHDAYKEFILEEGLLNTDGDLDKHIQNLRRNSVVKFAEFLTRKYQSNEVIKT